MNARKAVDVSTSVAAHTNVPQSPLALHGAGARASSTMGGAIVRGIVLTHLVTLGLVLGLVLAGVVFMALTGRAVTELGSDRVLSLITAISGVTVVGTTAYFARYAARIAPDPSPRFLGAYVLALVMTTLPFYLLSPPTRPVEIVVGLLEVAAVIFGWASGRSSGRGGRDARRA